MGMNFKKNGTTYTLFNRYEGNLNLYPSNANLVSRSGGSRIYIPAMSMQGTKVYAGLDSAGNQVYYDTSSPTIAFRKDGKTYYCAKSVTKESYSIPAGTYTISAFQTIIKNLYGISSWGTGVNGSYIEKTWSNTNIKQNNKFPATTSRSRKVRLYRYGNGDPFWSYDWLAGVGWTSSYNNFANLTVTNLAGIIMFAGDQCAYPIRPDGNTAWRDYYPVTVVDGINVI